MISFEDFLKEDQVALLEKMNLLKERLFERFGDRIFSDKYDYIISEEDMRDAYDILNDVVFDNQLPKDIPIHVVDFDRSKHYKETWRVGRNYGFLISRGKTYVLPNQKTKTTKFEISIVRSEDGSGKDNLSASISLMCHEMIHVLDALRGPEKKRINSYFSTGVVPLKVPGNEHSNFFQKEMKKINNLYGLDIKQSYIKGSDKIMTRESDAPDYIVEVVKHFDQSIDEIESSPSERTIVFYNSWKEDFKDDPATDVFLVGDQIVLEYS